MAQQGDDFSRYLALSEHAPIYQCLSSFSALDLSGTSHTSDRSLLEASCGRSPPDDMYCHSDNVEQCISHLNQEVTSMGMPSLYSSHDRVYSIVQLVNCTNTLLLKHQSNSRLREELEDKLHKLSCDVAHLKHTLQRTEEGRDQDQRDTKAMENKLWQVTGANNKLSVKLKEQQDEVKRLKSAMNQRETQHRHEVKKSEREITKLRERLNQLLSGRGKNTIQHAAMNMSSGVQRADGKRGTWKTSGQAKNEEELYKAALSSAEDKCRSVLVENASLRRCLAHVQNEINLLIQSNNNNLDAADSLIESCVLDSGRVDNESFSSECREEQTERGLYEMPYELAGQEIHQIFKDQIKQLQLLAMKAERKMEVGMLGERRASCGGSKVLSPRDEAHRSKEMDRLQKTVTRYKHIIEEQEKLIEQTLETQRAAAEASLRLRLNKEGSSPSRCRHLPVAPPT